MQTGIFGKIFAAITGTVIAILEPTVPYVIVCTIAVFMDSYTAWRLSIRVKKNNPQANDGKFKSEYARKVFTTITKIYSLIVLAYLIDVYILYFQYLYLPNIVAGAFCFLQFWSILENESSENGSRWAKIAQKIMVNKAERHFDVDLSELKKENPKDETK